jgi:phospholipid/cholesterol/gamma-HCH transport system substrate-binding protein
MRVSKEFKVGLLVLLAVFFLYIGVNFLKGNSIFGQNRQYYAVFDNANGLVSSNLVVVNGVQVGTVSKVNLNPSNPKKVIVKFTISNDEILIPKGSKMQLISSDLLGTKALELQLNFNPVVTAEYIEIGDTLLATIEKGISDQISEELLPLKQKTEELMQSVDNIVLSVNSYWDTSAAYVIDESLYEFRDGISKFGDLAKSLTVLVENESRVIDDVLHNASDITKNLANKSEQIDNVIDNFSAISDTLAASEINSVIMEAKTTLAELNQLMMRVNNGEGTLGLLMHSDSLHNELVHTNLSLQNLLDDMEANPNKYVHFSVFGRKTKEPK